MPKQTIELPVEKLSIGAYVSRLDRPWVETPFLFQGFTIRSEEEIAELRRLCRVVYVDVSAPESAAPAPRAPPVKIGRAEPAADDPLEKLSKNLAAGQQPAVLKDPVPLRTELSQVRKAFAEAKQTVASAFKRIRSGGDLDVRELGGAVDWMVESVFRNRDAISWLTRMKDKDDYLYRHSLASSVWALAFGRHLGLDKQTLRSVGMGAMLLDVGKTKLPDELLNWPQKPTAEQWKLLRSHVESGLQLASDAEGVDRRVLQMISTHHERFDGSGYPESLKGEDIQLVGRIAGIVDCYDAMTSERRYAKARPAFDAIREMQRLSGSWFQPELLELFVQAVGVFPTGTLVELNTGEVGVIVAQNRFRRLQPEVMLILDAQKTLRDDFTIVNLQNCEANNAAGQVGLWIERGLEPSAYGIDPTEYFL
jgi:HD-GYP domain-containing protein (c-di-GMP phosphodiesterase class II)